VQRKCKDKGKFMYSVKNGTLKDMIKELVSKVMANNGYNVAATAKELGMVRQSVYRYLHSTTGENK